MNRTFIAVLVAFFAAGAMVASSFAQVAPAAPTPAGDNPQSPAAPAAADKPMTTKVAATTGSADYRLSSDAAWKPVAVGVELPVGAELRTGIRGEITLDIGPNAHVNVERLSYVIIGKLEKDGDTLRSLLAVRHGKVHFKVDHVGFRNDFKIATPTGTMAVKGTEGDVTTDTTTDIDGNENNGGDAIHYTDSDGNSNNYTGGDSSGNQGGTTTGNPGRDSGNSNSGDGNGNGSGDSTPDTGAMTGQNSQQNSQQELQNNPDAPHYDDSLNN